MAHDAEPYETNADAAMKRTCIVKVAKYEQMSKMMQLIKTAVTTTATTA